MRTTLHPNAYVNPYSTLFRNLNEVADVMNRMRTSDTRPDAESVAASTDAAVPALAQPAVKLPVDAWVTDEAYVITAFVPGVNPDDVEILFEDDELTLRGSYPAAAAFEEGSKVEAVKRELFHGNFERRLTFRQPVNPDAIVAEYSQGVLTLRVPKAEVVKPRQIRVTAK